MHALLDDLEFFFLAMYMDVLGVNGGIYAIHDWLLESGFICDHFFLLNIVFFSLTDLRFENKVFFLIYFFIFLSG